MFDLAFEAASAVAVDIAVDFDLVGTFEAGLGLAELGLVVVVAAAGLQAPNLFVADQDTTDFVVAAGYLVAMVVSVAPCRGPRLAAELAAD